MNFHAASRGGGSPLTLASQQGVGGSCLKCSNKIIKFFPHSLRSLDFLILKTLIFA